jgi:hypothetical protein
MSVSNASLESVKRYVIGSVVPIAAGALATYLASKRVLNVYGISNGEAVTLITGGLTFVVTASASWLTTHHIFKGTYTKPPVV